MAAHDLRELSPLTAELPAWRGSHQCAGSRWHIPSLDPRECAEFAVVGDGACRLQPTRRVTPVIACIHYYWVAEANPYREAQTIVALLLVVGLYGWRRWRPSPSLFMRGYIFAASIATVGSTCAATCGESEAPDGICAFVLKASIVLTLSLYIEIIRTLRKNRIAQATANYRISSSSA